jgi:hypothetical protein
MAWLLPSLFVLLLHFCAGQVEDADPSGSCASVGTDGMCSDNDRTELVQDTRAKISPAKRHANAARASGDGLNQEIAEDIEDNEAVRHAAQRLWHEGSKGSIAWEAKSAEPCQLVGDLTYEDRTLTFSIKAGEAILTEADGTVLFATNVDTNGGQGAVTVENETFTLDSSGALLHLGKHHRHFHMVNNETALNRIKSADSHTLEASLRRWDASMNTYLNDQYDNSFLELLVALAVQNVTAKHYTCLFSLHAMSGVTKDQSQVIDADTASDWSLITMSNEVLDAAEVDETAAQLHEESLLAADEKEHSAQGWPWSRRRRGRCPYNHCGNDKFGRCGDGAGVGCIWIWCWNCDCNWGCEQHDNKCHCTSGGCPWHDFALHWLVIPGLSCSRCSHDGCR